MHDNCVQIHKGVQSVEIQHSVFTTDKIKCDLLKWNNKKKEQLILSIWTPARPLT